MSMNQKPLKNFKDLMVWQRAVRLAAQIYEITKDFPNSEVYGLTSQMRRAAISVSSNIAEGFGRAQLKEKTNFYTIAHGSLAELESQTAVALSLRFIDRSQYDLITAEIVEISKMTDGLRKALATKPSRSPLAARAGFTLVELLVAIALFSIIVAVAVGGFARALRAQKQLVALIAANSNASLAIEEMAREMRTGRSFECAGGGLSCEELSFSNARGEEVVYRKLDTVLLREVNDRSEPMTADNVDVRSLSFVLFGEPGYPPRITIAMGVGSLVAGVESVTTNMQTTVSSRSL